MGVNGVWSVSVWVCVWGVVAYVPIETQVLGYDPPSHWKTCELFNKGEGGVGCKAWQAGCVCS